MRAVDEARVRKDTPLGIVHKSSEEVESDMCRAVRCRKCGKTTWAGCGQHVDQVMRTVPLAERCLGHPKPVQRRRTLLERLRPRS
jgi:hypothetical protein